MIDIGMFVGQSKSDGPGKRAVLWVNGCDKYCDGCVNRCLWKAGKKPTPIKILAEKIFKQDIEGVTFCGGEPFLQANALSRLALLCKERNLSIVTFTGFLFDELKTVPDADKLLALTDILIDGPYKKDLPEKERHWVGSSNQKFYFLTNRYFPGIEYPKDEKIIGPRSNYRYFFERIQ